MDLKLVKKILDLISESEVDEVSIEEGDFKISVKKNTENPQAGTPLLPHPGQQTQIPVQQPPLGQDQPESTQDELNKETGGETVRSPIVGTFYRSPSPDSDPFVEIGDHIEKGETLCIVEAMKIMNEIEAEFSGTVQKIVAEDAHPVEYDQPLFIIKKD